MKSELNEVSVLLVDDNPRDAELTQRSLRSKKLANEIVHVTDGQAALDWLFAAGQFAGRERRRPHLVLLDLKLPRVDGLDVLKAIRAAEETRLLPVVVLTSSRQERDIVDSYRLGVNSYIVKPVDFENFSAAVLELGHYWLVLNEEPG